MRPRRRSIEICAIVIMAAIGGGCGAEHRGEPEGPSIQPDDRVEAQGERLFLRFCFQCHPGGAAGLGPALNNKPLPKAAIETQIRKGVGAMPAFEDLLSETDIDAIAAYVQEMRATRTH